MTGCGGCLGRLVLLVLLAWAIRELARLLGWSDPTTGSLFLLGLAVQWIRGSGRGRISGTARPAGRLATRIPLRRQRREIGSDRRWDGLCGRSTPRGGRTSTRDRIRRARDPIPAGLRFRILARNGFRCRYYGRPGSAPGVVLHVDHVVPVAAGGTMSEDNFAHGVRGVQPR